MQLLSKLTLNGGLEVSNRVMLAPLTRGRATEAGVPTPIMALYYAQRASGGLLVTEATGINKQGLGWYCAPGVYNDEQVNAWKSVTKAVHEKNGKIAMQLWHMGRQAHSDVTGQPIVSASAIAISGEVTAVKGEKKPYEVPVELSIEQIKENVKDYGLAAKRAIEEAGFDAVEVHAANGYLIDQFSQSATNKRTDMYGGSIENRLRFLKEVVEEIVSQVGPSKVGVRLSPNGAYGEMGSEDNVETFNEAIRFLASKDVAYVHLMDGLGFGFHKKCEPFTLEMARKLIKDSGSTTSLVGNVGYTKDSAEEQIKNGNADMIAFGRPYISNPDLVERFRDGNELAEDAPYPTWWGVGMGEEGYTTWPTFAENEAKKQEQ
mmetsp:Transcript_9747/g.15980  ORF Transcript_9747/g.15980 Transcript_9747/m.15980 type:complete len:376 (+) Transcript_9747:917-2044(+)